MKLFTDQRGLIEAVEVRDSRSPQDVLNFCAAFPLLCSSPPPNSDLDLPGAMCNARTRINDRVCSDPFGVARRFVPDLTFAECCRDEVCHLPSYAGDGDDPALNVLVGRCKKLSEIQAERDADEENRLDECEETGLTDEQLAEGEKELRENRLAPVLNQCLSDAFLNVEPEFVNSSEHSVVKNFEELERHSILGEHADDLRNFSDPDAVRRLVRVFNHRHNLCISSKDLEKLQGISDRAMRTFKTEAATFFRENFPISGSMSSEERERNIALRGCAASCLASYYLDYDANDLSRTGYPGAAFVLGRTECWGFSQFASEIVGATSLPVTSSYIVGLRREEGGNHAIIAVDDPSGARMTLLIEPQSGRKLLGSGRCEVGRHTWPAETTAGLNGTSKTKKGKKIKPKKGKKKDAKKSKKAKKKAAKKKKNRFVKRAK